MEKIKEKEQHTVRAEDNVKKSPLKKTLVRCAILSVAVFTVVLTVLLVGDLINVSPKRMQKRCEEASAYLENMFGAIEAQDMERISEYFVPEELITDVADKYSIDKQNVINAAFENFTSNIQSAENLDTYTVEISAQITTANLYKLYGNAIRSNISSHLIGLSDPELTSEEKDEMLISGLAGELNNALAASSADTVTRTVNIRLTEEGSKWTIDMTEELADVLMGGINSAVETVDINSRE